ncbi:MAG TPA: branched-chain amino acid ABC transporter permease [Anaerolineales bacterium]|nr:branched-chain amino acid ABC transporter permease [Anaerolineales bacterium]HMR98423.1 branched-chain amino acid ABC transporter permease [Anaerolineales bacterium]HNQ93902.1 branched-chain amino acid ABC transporter permease [Anaerolineales bacterium]HNS60129.1 branched-chain amino acid ABC transporter permease [Anaerolineales bacterium]
MRQRFLNRINFTDIALGIIGVALVGLIVVGSFRTLAEGNYTTRQWLDFVVFGIAQGSIYALIALGYTLVYGILRMINFAHSEVFMAGSFTAYFAAAAMAKSGFLEANTFVAILILFGVGMVTSIIVGVLVERIAYRPLRRAPRLVPLITAIGASEVLKYVFKGLYGDQFKAYPEIEALKGSFTFGDFNITRIQVVVILSAALLMLGLYLYVQHTKVGKAMRAVSEDKDIAALMGINVDAIIVRTFVLGAALAGAAGILYALTFRQVNFFMGFFPGIKAFTAAVLGGIGNIPGAMVGGIFLGLFESVGPILFLDGLNVPAPYQLKDVIAFSMLVLVLLFRPSGILGERLSRSKA